MPAAAGFPAPVTTEEKTAVASYLDWLGSYSDDDKEKTRRLRAVSEWCVKR